MEFEFSNLYCDDSAPFGICIVEYLLEKPFSLHLIEEKRKIVAAGKPTPNLSLTQSTTVKNKEVFRHFQVSYYEKYKWLCACKKVNKLYCWPCLLFAKDRNIWTKDGYHNLNNFFNASEKHDKSQNHIAAVLSLKLFENFRIDLALDNQRQLATINHNKKVTENRAVLKRLIDVVCYLGEQELFQSRDENISPRNYMELLKLLSGYDTILNRHLEESTIFSATSNQIQNDLIDCIAMTILNCIKKEVNESLFVAILLEETSEVSTHSQLSTVLRYLNKAGEIQERLLGFKDISENRSTTVLAQHVVNIIQEFNCEEKLVAQSFDGAAVISEELNRTQAKIREIYPQALFIHCCAHVLNLTLSQSAGYIKECKLFFSTIDSISSFFSHSTKHVNALENFVKVKFPKAASIKWTCNFRTVSIVQNNRSMLVDFFQHILDNPLSWDKDIIVISRSFIHFLNDSSCIFLLLVFNDIFSYTDVLYNILKKKCFEVAYCIQQIEETKKKIIQMRSKFDEYLTQTKTVVLLLKRKRQTQEQLEQEVSLKRTFYEIIDTVVLQINIRYGKLASLKFIELLNFKKYDTFKTKFPDDLLDCLKETYAENFDFQRLENELKVLYSLEQCGKNNVTELYSYITDNNLETTLNEIFKLMSLIITIPYTTVSVERTFSTLERIKTYARNTTDEDRLPCLGMLAIEKDLLRELRSRNEFYEDVINLFAIKDREIQLEFI